MFNKHAIIGSTIGGLLGYRNAHGQYKAEGMLRGGIRGAGTDIGAGLGTVPGALLAELISQRYGNEPGGETDVMSRLGGLAAGAGLGGLAGYGVSGAILGKPGWEEEKLKDKKANHMVMPSASPSPMKMAPVSSGTTMPMSSMTPAGPAMGPMASNGPLGPMGKIARAIHIATLLCPTVKQASFWADTLNNMGAGVKNILGPGPMATTKLPGAPNPGRAKSPGLGLPFAPSPRQPDRESISQPKPNAGNYPAFDNKIDSYKPNKTYYDIPAFAKP